MRLTFVGLAFLFFTNVLATPINPSLKRRSSNGHDTPGKVDITSTRDSSSKAEAKCKRATPNKFIASLSTVDWEHPLHKSEFGGVYRMKVDNENVILKIQQNGMMSDIMERIIKGEAWANHNVEQLLGWGHTPNGKLYYLFLKNMGVPLEQTPFKDDHKLVEKLQVEAEKSYRLSYGLTHNDHHKDSNNWVYRKVGNKWRAELVDWEVFTKERGYERYTDPPEPFVIDPNCISVPPHMEMYGY